MTSPLEPVRPNERVLLLDVLRAFALLGILLVNFKGTTGSQWPVVDRRVQSALELLVSESFYPLFSLLFGVGFAIQLLRSRERGFSIAHVYLRRLLALFIIGTVHYVLIWDGDILRLYALLGLVLIPLHRLPVRALLVAIALLVAFQVEHTRLTDALESWADNADQQHTRELAEGLRDEDLDIVRHMRMRAESQGSFRENVALRWNFYGRSIQGLLEPIELLSYDVLLIFVIGLYVGRRGFLQDAPRHRRGFAVVAVVGAASAIAGYVLTTMCPDAEGELGGSIWMAANYGMTAFYVAGIAWVVTRGSGAPGLMTVFAPVGRMGLTNYLLQSAVMTFAFLPYELHAPDGGATVRVVVDGLFFFLVQVPLSRWWLAHFQYGPAEWLWRTLTYGVPQPMARLTLPATAG